MSGDLSAIALGPHRTGGYQPRHETPGALPPVGGSSVAPPGELLTWEPPTWEYREDFFPDVQPDAAAGARAARTRALNALGAEGWELVTTRPWAEGEQSQATWGDVYTFKRQRREEAPD